MTVHTQKQSYTLTIRGDHNFANIFGLNDDIDPLTPSGINVDVYTSNVIVWSSRLLQAHGFAVGAFESNGSARTLADVTGTVSRIEMVLNDERNAEPVITESWEIPVPLAFFNVWDADLPGDDFFQGSDGVNVLQGMGGDDRFKGLSDGSVDEGAGLVQGDWFYGGDGLDTSIYQGKISEYTITSSATSTDRVDIYDLRLDDGTQVPGFYVEDSVAGRDGNDRLVEVERLEFEVAEENGANRIALDIDGNAGTAAKIVGVLRGKEDLSNLKLIGALIYNLDAGMSYEDLMGVALDALLGADKTNEAIAELVYTNLVGESPTLEVRRELASYMDSGAYSQAGFARAIADLELNATNINLVGLSDTGLQYTEYVP